MNNLYVRLVIFLLRKKLGVKKDQTFQFENQRSEVEYYWFNGTRLAKVREGGLFEYAHVSLNWLLDDNCKVNIIDPTELNICASLD